MVIGGDEPSCGACFCERKVQSIQWTETEAGQFTSPTTRGLACRDRNVRVLEPKLSCQPAIFARIARVLEVMSGRAYKPEFAVLHALHDLGHRLRLSQYPRWTGIIERPLEAADVEVCDLAHAFILLPRVEDRLAADVGKIFVERAG